LLTRTPHPFRGVHRPDRGCELRGSPFLPAGVRGSRPERFRHAFHGLALVSTPANSCSSPLLSSKLTRAAVLAAIRNTPGVSQDDSRPRASSRGQNPCPQAGQW
jgi:hypothetical protein